MSSTNNNDCPDLTPNNVCNDSCCPDYAPQEEWCKAFNKRTLDQQRKTQQTLIDGMWHNLEDARNTVGQAEQYLAIIYELLLAIQDQIIKVSSFAAATEGDIESANSKIVEFLKEIDNIAESANYNGRRLLTSFNNYSVSGSENDVSTDEQPDASDIIFRFMGCNGFCRQVTPNGNNPTENDWTYELPKAGTAFLFSNNITITVSVPVGDGDGDGDVDVDVDISDAEFDHDSNPAVEITDASEIDPEVTKVNCAIKSIGVELDKLRAYRYVLCMREKQIKICKNGQEICYEHKCKL